MLLCQLCGHPIKEQDVEWINNRGELAPYHTGARYDPTTCAYIARHQPKNKDAEFFATRLLQDSFMR